MTVTEQLLFRRPATGAAPTADTRLLDRMEGIVQTFGLNLGQEDGSHCATAV